MDICEQFKTFILLRKEFASEVYSSLLPPQIPSSDLRKGYLGHSFPQWYNLLLRKKASFKEEREVVVKGNSFIVPLRSMSVFLARLFVPSWAEGVWQLFSEWMDDSYTSLSITQILQPGVEHYTSFLSETLPEHSTYFLFNKAFAHFSLLVLQIFSIWFPQ